MKEYITPCGSEVLLEDNERPPNIYKPNKPNLTGIRGCPIQAIRRGQMTAYAGLCDCGYFVTDTARAEGDDISP